MDNWEIKYFYFKWKCLHWSDWSCPLSTYFSDWAHLVLFSYLAIRNEHVLHKDNPVSLRLKIRDTFLFFLNHTCKIYSSDGQIITTISRENIEELVERNIIPCEAYPFDKYMFISNPDLTVFSIVISSSEMCYSWLVLSK